AFSNSPGWTGWRSRRARASFPDRQVGREESRGEEGTLQVRRGEAATRLLASSQSLACPGRMFVRSSTVAPVRTFVMQARALPLLPAPARPALLDVPAEQLRSYLHQRGQPPMRLKQIHRWLYLGRAISFDQMTDLPRGLREELAGNFSVFSTALDRALVSSD